MDVRYLRSAARNSREGWPELPERGEGLFSHPLSLEAQAASRLLDDILTAPNARPDDTKLQPGQPWGAKPGLSEAEISILLVDDNPDDIFIIRRLLSQYQQAHFKVTAASSFNNCLELLEGDRPDLLMLDYLLPAEDGLSFLKRANTAVRLPPVIIVTGQNDYRLATEAIQSGASDCIYKYAMTSQSLGLAIQQALTKFNAEVALSRFDDNVIQVLAQTAQLTDPTYGGSRLLGLSEALGRALQLNQHELFLLRYGVLLHDIGQLGVRNELILKPETLTEAELSEMRQHPVIGERLCSSLRLSREIGPIIRHHHERWDGSGYVDGLAGEEIPLLARIISVVDAYEAMTSDRPYRAALPEKTALQRLRDGAGSQWDPGIVYLFLDVLQSGPARSEGWQ